MTKRFDTAGGDARASLELRVLRALCREDSGAELHHLTGELSKYSWSEPEHATVFEAIRRVAAHGHAQRWHGQLPAQATRMGFPDIDWPHYLAAPESSGKFTADLVVELLRLSTSAQDTQER